MRDVLAVVENEEHVPARQLLDELIVELSERPFPEPCRRGDGPGHCGRLAHRGKVAEADPIPVVAAGPGGHLQR